MSDETRAGGKRWPAFFLTLMALAAFAASCYSSSYPKEMAANVDLISGLSDKLADFCTAGFTIGDRQISSEEMGEFYYALKKARAYAQMTRSHADRASYRDFTTMLDRYAAFVRSADEYRLSTHADSATLKGLLEQHKAVEQAASQVRTDLARENGSD